MKRPQVKDGALHSPVDQKFQKFIGFNMLSNLSSWLLQKSNSFLPEVKRLRTKIFKHGWKTEIHLNKNSYPYRVREVGEVADTLIIPKEGRLHGVFHVSCLKKVSSEAVIQTDLPLANEEGKLILEPKDILEVKVNVINIIYIFLDNLFFSF
jgi:hypothetical protein